MKCASSFLAIAFCLFFACQCAPEKIEYSSESPYEPIPNRTLAKATGIPFPDLRDGQHLFQRKCGECHRHQLPDTQKVKDWKKIVPHMSEISGLGTEEERLLLDYLLATRKVEKAPTN